MAKDLKIQLPADGSVQKTIAAARSAEKGPEYFVVLRFQGGAGSLLEVAAEGAGGWAEASAQLKPDDGGYVLLRKDHKVEMAKTVKFAFIEWFPNGLKAMRRIQLSGLKKPAEDLCKPFHVGLSASDLSDVNQAMIDARIGFVSGTASHVKDGGAAAPAAAAAAAPAADSPKEAAAAADGPAPAVAAEAPKPVEKKAPKPSSGGVTAKPMVSSGSTGIKFADGTAVTDALKEIRDDKKETNWVVANYADKDTLAFAGSGNDGFNGMIGKISDDGISFGLLRVTEMIDGKSKTTKFVFVKSIPPTIKPMKKAEITTRAGAIEKVFGQSHVVFDISQKTEITEGIVMDKVGAASGSKSNVKAK